jgi:hypothetical protein
MVNRHRFHISASSASKSGDDPGFDLLRFVFLGPASIDAGTHQAALAS